jgi:hypothetical protein
LHVLKEYKLRILSGKAIYGDRDRHREGESKGDGGRRVERREELVFFHMKRRCLRGAGSRTQETNMEPTCRLPLLTLLVAVVSLPPSSTLPLLSRMLEPGQYQFTGQLQGQYQYPVQHQGQYQFTGQHQGQYHPALHYHSSKSLHTFKGTNFFALKKSSVERYSSC